MLKAIRTNYNHTIYASYLGFITQAIVNNIAPILFIQLRTEFALTLAQITLFSTINFAVQLLVDLASSFFVDRVGYRPCIVAAHGFAVAGFVCMATLPDLLPHPYAGLLVSLILYAVGGGLIEVLASPIVEACPTDSKESAMSLLHSFYCWGQMGFFALSTLFFALAGTANWRIMCLLWALVPLFNLVYFTQVPMYELLSAEEARVPFAQLLRQKTFWLLCLLMLCAGASELSISQWASAFAESALHVTKSIGDLAGPCAFALFMGTARAIYGKFSDRLPLKQAIIGSAVLCIICYLIASAAPLPIFNLIGCALCGFSVGIFWPGTFSTAARLLPKGGAGMFALLALAGDLGCSSGPTLVGFVTDLSGGVLNTGLLAAIIFPVLTIVGMLVLDKAK